MKEIIYTCENQSCRKRGDGDGWLFVIHEHPRSTPVTGFEVRVREFCSIECLRAHYCAKKEGK